MKSKDLNTTNLLAITAIILSIIIGYFWFQDSKVKSDQNKPTIQSPFEEWPQEIESQETSPQIKEESNN